MGFEWMTFVTSLSHDTYAPTCAPT